MCALKATIICALFAITLGFSLPDNFVDIPNSPHEAIFEEVLPSENKVLIRNARSPQRVEAGMEHHSRHGTSASVSYAHPIGKNMEAYAGASRNFKYNDNSGHVGLRYNF